jgi:hypothetical protein
VAEHVKDQTRMLPGQSYCDLSAIKSLNIAAKNTTGIKYDRKTCGTA